jgi:hypothetical protein
MTPPPPHPLKQHSPPRTTMMNRADLRPSINIMTLGDGKLNHLFDEKEHSNRTNVSKQRSRIRGWSRCGATTLVQFLFQERFTSFFLLIRPLLLTTPFFFFFFFCHHLVYYTHRGRGQIVVDFNLCLAAVLIACTRPHGPGPVTTRSPVILYYHHCRFTKWRSGYYGR